MVIPQTQLYHDYFHLLPIHCREAHRVIFCSHTLTQREGERETWLHIKKSVTFLHFGSLPLLMGTTYTECVLILTVLVRERQSAFATQLTHFDW